MTSCIDGPPNVVHDAWHTPNGRQTGSTQIQRFKEPEHMQSVRLEREGGVITEFG